MKKLLYSLAALFIVCSCNQPDYSELAALEELCERINDDLFALQTLVSAMQENDFITGVTPLLEGKTVIGYTIGFSKNPDVTIYHGADGEKGGTPQIGVREETDGNYYWTLDGEWLTDREGGKIKAGAQDGKDGEEGKDGATPRLKIEEGYWHLSYDNGETWEQLGKATGENGMPGQDASPVFTDIKELEESVEFTLPDGTVISLAKFQPLSITFSPTGDITVLPNMTYRINYTLTGSDDETIVKATAQAELNDAVHVTDARSGYIEITTPHTIFESEVLVFVSDGRGRTIMRSIAITEGRMIVPTRYYPVESAGGIVSVPLSTNLDYRIEIPEECRSWITRGETRSAMRDETLTLHIAPNTSVESRIGSVGITSDGASIETVQIYQNSLNKSVPLRLLPDKSRIQQGDNVTFAVELEGYDVTAQARILNLSTGDYLPGNTYHADTGGTVQFVAEYDGLTSRKIGISTRDFFKKVISLNFVSNFCGYSPYMVYSLTQFRNKHPDLLNEITVHHPLMGEDPMIPYNAEVLYPYFETIIALPTIFVDIHTRILGALSYDELEPKISEAAAEYAPAGLAVTTYVRGKEIEVVAHATAAAEGEYYLGVMLIENGVVAPQAGAGKEYVHNNVFRKNLSPIPGESLGFFGKNEQKSVTYRTDISAYKTENCEIVCYLYTQEGDVLRAVNSTRCHAGEYTGYRFVD